MQQEQVLSDEQMEALGHQISLIEAGPGSGKTRTVVARFRERVLATDRGVALLSFTNAAVDVAKARCRDAPKLLGAPHFVGTFDEFFRRYVLVPSIYRTFGVAPTIVTSWDDLSDQLAVVRPSAGKPGIRLSVFTSAPDGLFQPDTSRMRRAETTLWDAVSTWTRTNLRQVAKTRVEELVASNVYDTDTARQAALAVLRSNSDLISLLRHRFAEVIVDEFQDCAEGEHEMLELLQGAGIHIVAVADPDQAIYEFRQTSTEAYQAYRGKLARTEIVTLSKCYRSAPAICATADSLRSVGMTNIVSAGDHSDASAEIYVIVGRGQAAAREALLVARQHGVSGGGLRILAHRRSDARALARSGKQPPGGTSAMEPLLTALADLGSSCDVRSRVAAIGRVERFLLSQLSTPGDEPRMPADHLKQIDFRRTDSDTL